MAGARKERSRLEKALVGPAGEHYVLYRLHAEGILASLAPRNAPTVDILVLNDDETVAATVQVKTRILGADGGWHMSIKHETLIRPRLFYVFVDLQPPIAKAFVIPSAIVAKVLRQAHAAWLGGHGRKGHTRRDTPMRRILPVFRDPVPAAPPGWLDRWESRFDQLKRRP